MGSMNLLGFSLSPQEHPSSTTTTTHQDHQTVASRFGFNPADGISATHHHDGTDQSCFDHHFTSEEDSSSHHSLNNLPPFSIYEAFHRNNNINHTTSQDWKENYNSQNNLLLGTSCINNQQPPPKLENFLGGNSFGDHHHEYHDHSTYGTGANSATTYCSLQLPAQQPEEAEVGGGNSGGGDGSTGNNSTNSIGLSMIKTWLRNQPPHSETNNNESSGGGSAGAARVQTLSLSMSTGSHSSSSLPLLTTTNNNVSEISSSSENKQPPAATAAALDNSNQAAAGAINDSTVPRKAIDTFGQRTSIYRGVTRHRWTGRYEAHLWDNSCRREGQTRKGRQVYLGGYDKEEKAARAYDLAALKYWGTTTTTNFPISHYEKEVEEMKHMTRQEYVASLRRKSSGFSRGASIYRGVTRHHQHGRWQARIGRVAGNKDLYLGTFGTQEEAAEAYDVAAIKFRGLSAVTNFDMTRYDVKSILESTTLPIGGAAKRLKDMEQVPLELTASTTTTLDDHSMISSITSSHNHLPDQAAINFNNFGAAAGNINWHNNALAFQQQQQQHHPFMHYPYGTTTTQRLWCKQEQDSDHTFPDNNNIHHQLQLGNINTHNFFQPSSGGGLHSIMNMDSASMDNTNNSSDYGGGGGSYVIPMGISNTNVIANDDGSSEISKGFSYESVFGSTDLYQHAHANARNLYYQQSSSVDHHEVKAASTYDQGSNNTWVPTAIPTVIAPRPNNMLCPPFTLMHDQ